ncbi:MAG: M3 family oligoendopeptidase [Alphaproteobacteria bacterium]
MDMLAEALPRWNLADLYEHEQAPLLQEHLALVERESLAFVAAYQGKIFSLSPQQLLEAIEKLEKIDQIASRLYTYAGLKRAVNVNSAEIGQFYQTIMEKITDFTTHLVFFRLEINALSAEAYAGLLKEPQLKRWVIWLEDIRRFKPHELPEQMEKLLQERAVAGSAAWVRLFDQLMAGLKIPLAGEDVTLDAALHQLSDHAPAKRQQAALALGKTLASQAETLSLIINTLIKDKEIDDRWRQFVRPVSRRNLDNRLADGVVDALVQAVRGRYSSLSHRYYRLKARWMGYELLPWWERNAPLPQDKVELISFAEAKDIILAAFADFSPELAAIAARFFAEGWIDAEPREGKMSGAFAHPAVPDSHPFIMVNYYGRLRDVMTLAHELGHGVHQLLAGAQGHFLSQTPLTLAETASVFSEMLVFQRLVQRYSEPEQQKNLLASKVEDMLNTVIRQIAFYSFEEKLHERRKEGEITAHEIGDIWFSVQRESLGGAIKLDEDYRYFWGYISHFIHTPFYVYSYAFGDCLVNALYQRYRAGLPNFEEHYKTLLKAGGAKDYAELLQPLDFDLQNPACWEQGLMLIEEYIDQLEKIA